MKPILIMKTGGTVKSMPSAMGDFESWIIEGMGRATKEFIVTSVYLGEVLPSLQSISAIIITGSPAMVTEKLNWIESSKKYLEKAVNVVFPVLGICFGHQLLAIALGGKVAYHPRGREIGTTNVYLTPNAQNDPLFMNLPAQFPVNVSHKQAVVEVPAGANVLAYNDFEKYHGLQFADNAWGVQFHPEFNRKIMQLYIKDRYKEIEIEQLDPENLYSQTAETPDSKGLLQGFSQLIPAFQ